MMHWRQRQRIGHALRTSASPDPNTSSGNPCNVARLFRFGSTKNTCSTAFPATKALFQCVFPDAPSRGKPGRRRGTSPSGSPSSFDEQRPATIVLARSCALISIQRVAETSWTVRRALVLVRASGELGYTSVEIARRWTGEARSVFGVAAMLSRLARRGLLERGGTRAERRWRLSDDGKRYLAEHQHAWERLDRAPGAPRRSQSLPFRPQDEALVAAAEARERALERDAPQAPLDPDVLEALDREHPPVEEDEEQEEEEETAP